MKKAERSRITKRIIFQYIIALASFAALLIGGVIFCAWICSLFFWDWTDPLYQFLNFIRENIFSICAVILLIGWFAITYFFVIRPLNYIDEIVAAAKQLAYPSEEQILLNRALYEIQYELNTVRERALRNAELAHEAEKRKNDLIIYLAHDLKTPLTSIIGYLTLLRDEPEISSEIRARYTGIALDKAERLEQLINEFFDITRFSLTTLTLEPQSISLSRMLEQTVSEFYPVFAEKDLTCTAAIQPETELVCDPDKLARVFDNLFRNAVNYSYANSEITLAMTAANGIVTVTVANCGKTVPKEKLDRIFEQFFRLDSARSTGTGGAGLGLAIAKEIVTLHGGSITAESENERIIFTVILPQNKIS
ncbi:MAG: HAMP domain-containing histidine kinase [Oscillospiraceae bacterium]